MKQKPFTGFSLMALAGVSFWACGEGSINKMDETDNLMAMQYGDHDAWVSFKEEQKDACKADMNCYIQYQGYIDGTELPPEDGVSSSSEEQQQQQQQRLSSAQGTINIDNDGPKSSATIIDPGQTTTSSSSAGVVAEGLGDCKPVNNPITKNEQTAWVFNGNASPDFSAIAFATATYEWNFGGLADDGSGAGATSGKVTYTTPNKEGYTATVTVSVKDKDGNINTETKTCGTKLIVNGDPILGCSCKSDQSSPKVDVAAGPVTVNWTVTCQTAVTGFAWTGATGTTATGSVVLNDKDVVKPSVTVSTDESALVVDDCDQVEGYNAATFGKDLTLPYQNQNTPLDAGTYRLTMTHEGWTGTGMGTLTYSTLQISVNGTCTVELNGVSKSISNNEAITNTDELVLLTTPANCVTGVSAY